MVDPTTHAPVLHPPTAGRLRRRPSVPAAPDGPHVGGPWLGHCPPSAVTVRHPRIRRNPGHVGRTLGRHAVAAVTPPATNTIASVRRRNATSGSRGPSVVPSQLASSEPGSQTRNAGERASVRIVCWIARIASPIAFAPTKYIARSARKLRGEALSRASSSTGATPLS